MVQLLAPYIDHESHSAQRYRQMTDRQTDVIAYDNSRSYCVAVRSAKKQNTRCISKCLEVNTYFIEIALKPFI